MQPRFLARARALVPHAEGVVDLPSHQQPTFPLPHRQTKQAENAGKSATQKKAEQKAAKAAKNEKKSFG